MYSFEEVLKSSKELFNGDELAADVYTNKYAMRNKNDELVELNSNDTIRRIAKEFARIEEKKFKKPYTEEEIFERIKDFARIIPQGSPIFAIGNTHQIVSTSNCFVVPSPEDSYGGILKTDQQIVQISKRRGGIGYDISTLRPKNQLVTNSARTTSGAVSFMHRFSNTGREVGQGGRRAAQMITMSVHHPDILDFIKVKSDGTSVTGANISVRLSDEFLKAVKNNQEYELRFPVDSDSPLVSEMVDANKVWKEIIHHAWLRAEPGILFWDTMIKNSPADCYRAFNYNSVSTNPCSEIVLSAYDSCRLMAINLFFYVKSPFTKDARFDLELFKEDARFAQRLMDDLIDLELEKIEAIIAKIESDPEEESTKVVELELWQNIHKYCKLGRRTGLGITALGDTLAALGLKYGSNESIECVDTIYSNMKIEAYRSSIDMAEELGPFEIFDYELEKNCPFIKGLPADLLEKMSKVGRRNIAILTTAPTGTISILAKIGPYCNTTSGIEPVFMTHYTRRKKINHGDNKSKVDFVDALGDKWSEYTVYHSGVKLWMDITGETDITKSPYYGACSPDIVWTQRVKLQSTAQKHVDHAISSTVNLPNDVSEEEVSKIYTTAWESGCKGMTVYRDGCRSGVLVTNSDKKDTGIVKTQAPKRPKEIDGDVHHITVGGESYVVIVGLLNAEPYEIFANKNDVIEKTVKKCKIIKLKNKLYKAVFDDESELSPVTTNATENEEVITRLSSISLRHGADIQFVVEQLLKLKGSMNSFAKSIARALKKYIKDGTKVKESCKECGAELIYEEGCMKCKSCGWTKCS